MVLLFGIFVLCHFHGITLGIAIPLYFWFVHSPSYRLMYIGTLFRKSSVMIFILLLRLIACTLVVTVGCYWEKGYCQWSYLVKTVWSLLRPLEWQEVFGPSSIPRPKSQLIYMWELFGFAIINCTQTELPVIRFTGKGCPSTDSELSCVEDQHWELKKTYWKKRSAP